MKAYPTVPGMWYTAILAGSVLAALALIQFMPGLQLPAWGLLLSVIIVAVFMIPVGIIAAVSESVIGSFIRWYCFANMLPANPRWANRNRCHYRIYCRCPYGSSSNLPNAR